MLANVRRRLLGNLERSKRTTALTVAAELTDQMHNMLLSCGCAVCDC